MKIKRRAKTKIPIYDDLTDERSIRYTTDEATDNLQLIDSNQIKHEASNVKSNSFKSNAQNGKTSNK